MEAALRQNYQASKYHSLDEFADKLAKKLGQHYGINDIRDARPEESTIRDMPLSIL